MFESQKKVPFGITSSTQLQQGRGQSQIAIENATLFRPTFSKTRSCDVAWPLARALKKLLVSLDPRLPTSATRTTRKPSVLISQFQRCELPPAAHLPSRRVSRNHHSGEERLMVWLLRQLTLLRSRGHTHVSQESLPKRNTLWWPTASTLRPHWQLNMCKPESGRKRAQAWCRGSA